MLAEIIVMLTLFSDFIDDSEGRKKIWRSELLSTLKNESTENHLYKLSTSLNCYKVIDEENSGAKRGKWEINEEIGSKNYSTVTV